MDSSSYTHLLEKTRLPQPSLQRFAVISLFQKLKSAPSRLGIDSDPGRDAVSHCLRSSSAAVADQSVRELCRLVKEGHVKVSVALIELQSALEGCDSRFVAVFVKGIGFLCRFSFLNDPSWGCHFDPVELHPFVKVLSCRDEVQTELIQQVLLFITHCKSVGMEAVSGLLRPFIMFSVLRIPFSGSAASSFVKDLVSAIASLSCSFPSEAISLIKLVTGCLKYFPQNNEEELKFFLGSAEYMVDALVVALKQMVGTEQLTKDAQACGVELLETLISIYTYFHKPHGGIGIVLELSKRLLLAQKELGLHYLPEFVSITVSFSIVLTLIEFEHEQLSILKLLIILLKWKSETAYIVSGAAFYLHEELLVVFPVINLLSSPSESVKAAATVLLMAVERHLLHLLVAPKKVQFPEAGYPSIISKPESIIFRLLYHLWFQEQSSFSHSFFLRFACNYVSVVKERYSDPECWTSQLKEYSLSIFEKLKITTASQSQENPLAGISLVLSAIVSILIMHPMFGASAIDSLAAIGGTDPKLGMALLLTILFYYKMICSNEGTSSEILLKLLEMLPSLALHSVMVPLIIQTILPMLHKDAKPVLYATAVRLLCKTWLVTDRAFGSLQGILDPKAFTKFISKRDICISMAASVRDVCRHNPDRGVDLILSVSSCIESSDSSVQALGFESLAHLCEADVVDFYTAWNVIAKHMLDYSADPIIAHGLCTLLRSGAMDAEAYSEASKNVIQILWKVGTSRQTGSGSLWAKARASAFESLSHYEVEHVQETILDFKKRNLECLVSEDNAEVLKAMEGFIVKIINFEHITRRRVLKEKKIIVHKVEKLLDVFPQVMFPPGKQKLGPSELPGSALLSHIFTPKDLQGKGTVKDLPKLHAAYENALLEIAESLHVSRSILVALLALQSWKPFIHHWMRSVIMLYDAKMSPNELDRSSKAANGIFKILCKVAMESTPRVAINIALAIGALCMVLPPSARAVTSAASKFLLKWLYEYEHEHKQWSAAISLGLVSNCFHATDRRQKYQVITELLKVICTSKSHLVIGACGVGLGFACQDLLTWREVDDDSNFEERNFRPTEATLLGNIISTLSLMIRHLCPSSNSLKGLKEISSFFGDDAYAKIVSHLPCENCDNMEEDAWGIAGLVLGLGNSIVAVYRFGAYDVVLKIKDMLVSWIPHVDSTVQCFRDCDKMAEIPLALGSCLALPIVMAFCQRAELMVNDIDGLFSCYCSLISELLEIKKSGTLHQNLLMVSCIGAGSLLSCILNDGVHLKFNDVKHLLGILRNTYVHPYPPAVHLGGMLGVVNAFGAGAGTLTHLYHQPSSLQINLEQKESSYIRGPILSSPVCEPLSTSMIQEMFLVAKDSEDQQIQSFAAWALSFLRHRWWSKEFQNVYGSQSSSVESKQSFQSFAEDSFVWKLSSWLMDLNCSETGEIVHVRTVATVLRCLSKAPRLPAFDWGAIIRCCMRYETQFSSKTDMDQTPNLLREECIHFSLAHANDVNPLLLFLDELTDQSRFRTLELNLQSSLLHHLSDLLKVFSVSRLEKLCDDMVEYFSSSSSSYVVYKMDHKSFLRLSFWKGLHECLTEASTESVCVLNIEKCMEFMFCLLPMLTLNNSLEEGKASSREEWSEAIRCLAKARQSWLMDLLQVPEMGLGHKGIHSVDVARRILARSRLVKIGCLPVSELGKLKAYILNARSEGIWWSVLIEVVAAVSTAEGSIKRQWLLDALEISCVTEYPSTALQFIGLLSSGCCKYMPLLILDPVTVLTDLPVSLPSFLLDSGLTATVESLVAKLWTSTERIFSWAANLSGGDGSPTQDHINESESQIAVFLARVMHQTCSCLREYLPFEKQLRLANLSVP